MAPSATSVGKIHLLKTKEDFLFLRLGLLKINAEKVEKLVLNVLDNAEGLEILLQELHYL